MFITQVRARGAYDIQSVKPQELAALLHAVRHEIVRSQARQDDERLADDTREKERETYEILRTCQRLIEAKLDESARGEAVTIH